MKGSAAVTKGIQLEVDSSVKNTTIIYDDTGSWLTGFTYCAFLAALVLSAALQYALRSSKTNKITTSNQHFRSFQKRYFAVYFLALFGDWLQGPYIYKLYSHYGFSKDQIAVLYCVGFSASVLFGTGTGVLADYFGRKKMCIAFCFTSSLCCLMKLSSNYNVLLLGRLFGGISASLLFSVFESWYVYEHIQNYDFPKEWISVTFSLATFWNGVLAIIAGMLANFTAEYLQYGPVSPFVSAIPCFLFGCILIFFLWGENYGKKQSSWFKMCSEGIHVIASNKLILCLGGVQSIYESAMYIFVFLWTPVIDVGNPPLGMIFSVFMVCIMVGSCTYQLLLDRKYKPHDLLMFAATLMALSLGGCTYATSGHSTSYSLVYFCFMLLEFSVGIYFPAIGFLKSQYIPESHRANIMNWFRVPLNIIASLVLLYLHNESNTEGICLIFMLCSVGGLACTYLSLKVVEMINALPPTNMELSGW